MSNKYRLNLTLFGLLLLLAAAGLLAFLTAPESFDNAYEACEPGDADLTLHVNYQVRGTTGERDCAFPYRKRDRMTRLWEWYQDVRGLPCSRTYYVNGESGASMNSHGGDSENWSTWTEEVPEGVEFVMTLEDMPVGTKTAKQMTQGGTMIINTLKAIVENGRPTLGTRMIYGVMRLTEPLSPKRCRVENWPLAKN